MKQKMLKILKQQLWMTLMILSYILFSYYVFRGRWNSSIGTILILIFSYLIWGKSFLKPTGLSLTVKTVVKSLLLVTIITFCSLLLMKFIVHKQGIVILFTSWKDYYHDVFYVLNEEIILGPIILFNLVYKKKLKPLLASIGLAFAFSIIHFIFYKWIFDVRGIVCLSTLLSLFFIGIFRNNLILYTGHIAYSWVFHFGWIAVMLGSKHVFLDSGIELNELQKFNLYLGSTEMIILTFTLALISLAVWFKYPSRQINKIDYSPL